MPSPLFDRSLDRIDLIDGSTVYRTMGSGPPVLLIHGYPETHVCWHRIAPRLAERHTVVMADLPGYGDSDGPTSIATFHWPFLAQPGGLPETLIADQPDVWLDHLVASWSRYPERIDSDAVAEYRRCFRQRKVIDGTCADYRAGATIDVDHDESDREAGRTISCPLLVLSSSGRGDLIDIWTRWASDVRCEVLDGGHFLPEENPDAVLAQLLPFIASR